MIKSFSLLFLVFASVILLVSAIPTPQETTTASVAAIGNQITLSAAVLCTYLPPQPGGNIADHENDAQPFCNSTSDPNASQVNLIPDGFIKSAHFAFGTGYVQFTGLIDITKYSLSPSDEGGQYDSVGAPPDAKCVGKDTNGNDFTKFVNLIEPSDGRYCVRCCSDAKQCNTGKSEFGCPVVIPGDYS